MRVMKRGVRRRKRDQILEMDVERVMRVNVERKIRVVRGR
jgi:hypothetical protein